MADHHDAVAGGDPEDCQEPDERAKRDDAVTQVCRQNSADKGEGQCQEDQRGQAPVPKGGQQKEEDGDRGEDREAEKTLLDSLPLSVFAEELGVVTEWEVNPLQTTLDIARDRAEVAAADVGVNVDATRDTFVLDKVRRWPELDIGDLTEAYMTAVRGVNQQLLDVIGLWRVAGAPQTTTS